MNFHSRRNWIDFLKLYNWGPKINFFSVRVHVHGLWADLATFIGLFQKKIVPPLLRISIFLKLNPLDFQSNLPCPSWNFPFLCIDPPENPCFFLNFWCTLLEFQRLLLYPPEFSIDIINRVFFFWKSPLFN